MLIGELVTPVDPAIVAFADSLARAMPRPPLGVLFYGSLLRESLVRVADAGGVIDFYVVMQSAGDIPGGCVARLANRLLPPNVRYAEFEAAGEDGRRHVLRAKVAILSAPQFASRASPRVLDTTVWARFCQPARLVWVRDGQAADGLLGIVARCVATAALWAALLGPPRATACEYWYGLFARTYDSELRVEGKGRPADLLAGREQRFTRALTLGWARARLSFKVSPSMVSGPGEPAVESVLEPAVTPRMRARAARRWTAVRRSGKRRNVARLLKASFTFSDGAAYLAWKIRRHTGIDLALSPFERRHPLLSLPVLMLRLKRLSRAGRRN